MLEALTIADDLKSRAQRARKKGDLRQARVLIDESIVVLERAQSLFDADALEADPGKQLAAALADAYGSKGGILRTAEDYEGSVEAYDKGYRYESDPQYGFANSYNLTQRLVARIFMDPQRVAKAEWRDNRVAYPESFAEAEEKVSRQLAGPRVDDPWAMADRAMLLLLLMNDVSTEQRAWRNIQMAEPPAYVFSSTKNLIDELRKRMQTIAGVVDSPRLAEFERRLRWAGEFLERASA